MRSKNPAHDGASLTGAMIRLDGSLDAWPGEAFAAVVKRELLQHAAVLPLEQGVSQGGIADAADMDLTVLKAVDLGDRIHVKCGAFFTEVVGGCSCGDDPLAESAYCEMNVFIDKATAVADIRVQPG